MKIVVACDSFKGSLTSAEVNDAIAAGLRAPDADNRVECVSIADGGEGTGAALARAYDATGVTVSVPGPLGEDVDALMYLGADRRTAIIDTAAASGLPLTGDVRRPLQASSFGTGRQIAAALEMGYTNIILGLGGSATVDCGTGLLQALGYRFLDAHGLPLGRGAEILPHIATIDSSRSLGSLRRARITLFSDVDNPLCGPDGAAFAFGPQKGVSPDFCPVLDEWMECFVAALRAAGYDDTSAEAGSGAAGGIGCALTAILGAEMQMGAPAVLEAIDFENIILDADLIITGEGRMEHTTLHGKAPFTVLQYGRRHGIPVYGICGSCMDRNALLNAGFADIIAAKPDDMPLHRAMLPGQAAANLRRAARKISTVR